MNVLFDYKFGNFIIPRGLILYSSKHFFAMVPPNQIAKGRKNKKYIINLITTLRYIIMFEKRSRKLWRFIK